MPNPKPEFCPGCRDHTRIKIIESRDGVINGASAYIELRSLGITNYTRRRRQCTKCGHKWTTAELHLGELLQIAAETVALQRDQQTLNGLLELVADRVASKQA